MAPVPLNVWCSNDDVGNLLGNLSSCSPPQVATCPPHIFGEGGPDFQQLLAEPFDVGVVSGDEQGESGGGTPSCDISDGDVVYGECPEPHDVGVVFSAPPCDKGDVVLGDEQFEQLFAVPHDVGDVVCAPTRDNGDVVHNDEQIRFPRRD